MNIEQTEVATLAIEHPDILTDWEYDWINDIADSDDEGMFGSDKVLTEKQVAILERIQGKLEDANLL